jgi:PIN like domain
MRILLDECVPRPLKRQLTQYEVKTVTEMGWAGTKNGQVLKKMQDAQFTIPLTTDQNLRYQRNLEQAGVAIASGRSRPTSSWLSTAIVSRISLP